jgi:hypothetical protein
MRSNPQNVAAFNTQPVTTTLRAKAEWPYEVSLNVIFRIKYGLEAFANVQNIGNHHYATVYDGGVYPGETLRGLAGLRFKE